jgi:hypothetical protein
MSSCCGMPPRSQEPEYPMPPSLEILIRTWEGRYPGFLQAASEDIGCGDWDAMKEGDTCIPPYTPARAVEACKTQLARIILQQEQDTKRKQGSWHVRWGITKLSDALSSEGAQAVVQFEQEAAGYVNEPVFLSGAQFQYQIHYKPTA